MSIVQLLKRIGKGKNIVIIDNKIIEDPVVTRAIESLLGYRDKGLTVYLRRDLPIGAGFGISGDQH